MFKGKKIAVIIAGAGNGKRMASGIPKQFMQVSGEPMLFKTVAAFHECKAVDSICIVTVSDYVAYCKDELIKHRGMSKIVAVVKGGVERQDSVYKGIEALEELSRVDDWKKASEYDYDYLLIHDAARPYVSQKLIFDVIEYTMESNAATAAVPVTDTIRQIIETGSTGVSKTISRERLFAVQTPQGFDRLTIIRSHRLAMEKGFVTTDDASLVEWAGSRVTLVPGDYHNIKITTKEDLKMETKVGTGFDVHELVPGRKLILGGVEVPYEKGLMGHSDADVLCHAIIDALLGATGLGDIGRLFPDTDPQFAGVSSLMLLDRVSRFVTEKGYVVINIDSTIIAQEPKMAPHIAGMIFNLANVLNITPERISIKSTTTERLGFTGRGEGIAAQAVCTVGK